jgi:hypothetical protein
MKSTSIVGASIAVLKGAATAPNAKRRSGRAGGVMGYYILGLVIVLLMKVFLHNRHDSQVEWVRRLTELPADASILALLTIVAATAVASNQARPLNMYILGLFGAALISVILYKYAASLVNDQGGQIQFDSISKFSFANVANVAVAISALIFVGNSGAI